VARRRAVSRGDHGQPSRCLAARLRAAISCRRS
jgi:hypothetical protein